MEQLEMNQSPQQPVEGQSSKKRKHIVLIPIGVLVLLILVTLIILRTMNTGSVNASDFQIQCTDKAGNVTTVNLKKEAFYLILPYGLQTMSTEDAGYLTEYLTEYDAYKEQDISTGRGIRLGSTIEDVLAVYKLDAEHTVFINTPVAESRNDRPFDSKNDRKELPGNSIQFGWCQKNGVWVRLTYDELESEILRSTDEDAVGNALLIYGIGFDNNGNVENVYIHYE